ncbi:MAG: FecR domain-containing protein [Bacteroidales bacterium]|nr:FecR domain-containing protein [Bacteroidales bacterium]
MTDELLFKYFSNEASAEEVAQIEQWLDEDPARQSEFDSAHYLFNAMILHSDELSKMTTPGALEKTSRKSKVRRLVYRYAAAAAAVVIAGLSGVFVEREINYNKMTAQTNVLEVPAGQRMSVTLSDGTQVQLNGNSRIEYPVIFSRKQRNVKLSGEAFFEVKHDERHPFIVETFASKVEVLGTRFNVYADEASEYFSAALVDGKVKVTTNDETAEQVVLAPDEMVRFVNNHLVVTKVDAENLISWTEGYVNLADTDFESLMRRFENVYGVKIVIERETMPEIGYKSGKIRVSEGVNFALKLLQHECKFTYTENYETNTITIR